ncbi:MAG: alkaline phosphatase family protein [Chthoniobacterales bacterium]|nr:alkaline phosphatase family protein [Chthoniobacterales bacterium]
MAISFARPKRRFLNSIHYQVRESLVRISPFGAIVRTLTVSWCAICAIFAPALSAATKDTAHERHVVLLVWDGMRPDFVGQKTTPTLWQLAHEGVQFQNHHAVYPTSTEVNGAALATGTYPNRTSLLANREYRPRIDFLHAIDTGDASSIKKGDETSGGNYLALPTVAELVRAAGRQAVIAGSKSAALLADRHAEWTTALSEDKGLTVFAAAPTSSALSAQTQHMLGPFLTKAGISFADRNIYTTHVLTEILWRNGIPDFSLLWLSDPDLTQHETAPGSPASLAAIKSSDDNLARVLRALEKRHARATTDVIVVSDHGFSTIERAIDFASLLRQAGFDAVSSFDNEPKPGQIMVVGNGGTVLFYVIGHDPTVTAKLVDSLQRSDCAGVIFARDKFEGTFPLAAAQLTTADAPDLVIALRWTEKANQFGTAGSITTDAARGVGHGSHATLSRFDVHNICIANGPHFRREFLDIAPTSNADVAPTIVNLLGLDRPDKMDGRVLGEAFASESEAPKAAAHRLEATRQFSDRTWRQWLQISTYGGASYLDQGNGASEPIVNN